MDTQTLLNLLIGPVGALILSLVANYMQYRRTVELDNRLNRCQEDRLQDAQETEMVAKAYLKLRKQDRDEPNE